VFLDVVQDNFNMEMIVKIVIQNAKNVLEIPIKIVPLVNQEKFYIMVNA